ncbi:glycosyltransferase [Nostoc sp. TCL26-01]|uniref:glycosyltransferase n=1 Tax=Nostoc sp. TCL26-01 TaxID=2576904 RepID=UPI0015BCD629|nr:glycosyltransferase [Nostoc sp. TCL26-01]QLE56565.1 hypothetical protein FD725_14205 [Nostoc sp. TCL26-01]
MKALVTLCTGDEFRLGQVTHPLLKAYADKIGADFIVISEFKMNLGNYNFEKFQIYEMLEKYDRLIYIDTDIIVKPECPDLFKLVPEDKFGAFLVSDYTYFHDGAINNIQDKLGNIGWKRTYFNAGVMVVSKCHQEIFSDQHGLLEWSQETGSFYDQTLLNYTIQKLNIPIHNIGYKFNHTTDVKNSLARFGRRINQLLKLTNQLLSAIYPSYQQYQQQKNQTAKYIVYQQGRKSVQHRFHSYIIHYTGKGHRGSGSKVEQIKKDLSILQQKPLASTISFLPLIENFI